MVALIRTEPGKTKEALTIWKKICKELNHSFPFTYNFSDEEYNKLYKSEQIVSKLANVFAFLGIFISCLGLLGLAMFYRRTTEPGNWYSQSIGLSLTSLFGLLSKNCWC